MFLNSTQGLTDVGNIKPGETCFVSGAAGAVGSVGSGSVEQ